MKMPSATRALDDLVRPLARRERTEGYSMSSFDLRNGLEVRVMAPGLVPADAWHELTRLQALWRAGSERRA
jgi:hypothetical protein